MPTKSLQKTRRSLVEKLERGDRFRFSARDTFDAFALLFHGKGGLSRGSTESLFPYIEMAFAQLGLSGKSERDWKIAALALSFAIFARRESGRRTYWTAERRKRLRKDVEAMQKEHPELSTLEICKRLLVNAKYADFKGTKAGSLRRALYRKKKGRVSKRKTRDNNDDWE